LRWQIFADGSDLSIGDGNVCQIRIGCGHDGTISNDRVETHQGLHWRNEKEIMLHCGTLVLHNPLPDCALKGIRHAFWHHAQA
jgi:hypothetical protein